MKHMRRLICMALMIATVLSLSVSAFAAEYTFESTSDSEYYPSTSYEDIYGSYNYGGINVVDYQIPELSYGCFSTTQTGVMEKVRLPGLQQYVNVSTSAGGYGVGAGSYGTPVISSGTTITPVYAIHATPPCQTIITEPSKHFASGMVKYGFTFRCNQLRLRE